MTRRSLGIVHLTALVALALASLTGACSSGQGVERREGANVLAGRKIQSRAYAWYLRGRVLEQSGRLDAARRAYDQARKLDRKGGAAWAALAATYCTEDQQRALELFARGLESAEERAPLLVARGRCLLEEQPEAALTDAQEAFRRAPTWPEASYLLADSLSALGNESKAELVLRGLALYQGIEPRDSTSPHPSLSQVDRELRAGSYARARSFAAGRLSPGELAIRALALGDDDFAREQAAISLDANPGDADAQVVRLLSSQQLPPHQVSPGQVPGALASCLLSAELQRRVGAKEACLWLQRLETGSSPSHLEVTPTAAVVRWSASADARLSACASSLLPTLRPEKLCSAATQEQRD